EATATYSLIRRRVTEAPALRGPARLGSARRGPMRSEALLEEPAEGVRAVVAERAARREAGPLVEGDRGGEVDARLEPQQGRSVLAGGRFDRVEHEFGDALAAVGGDDVHRLHLAPSLVALAVEMGVRADPDGSVVLECAEERDVVGQQA